MSHDISKMYWARYVIVDQALWSGGMRSSECPSIFLLMYKSMLMLCMAAVQSIMIKEYCGQMLIVLKAEKTYISP